MLQCVAGHLQVVYEISPNGALTMSWSVDTRTFMPLRSAGHMNSFPRIGVQLSLPQTVRQCLWHGKCGPGSTELEIAGVKFHLDRTAPSKI